MEEEQVFNRILIKVVNKEPRLTAHGVGIPDESNWSQEECEEEFRREKRELFNRINSFQLACMYLSLQERTKNINPDAGTSYGLKHEVEIWAKEMFGGKRYGVPNGSLIAAAIHLGFLYKLEYEGSLNVYLNISKNRVKGKIL